MRILLVCILTGLLASCGQNTNNGLASDSSGSEYPMGAIREAYEGIPGLEKVYVRGNDGIREEGDYYNGKKHGSWTEYFKNGPVGKVTTYFNGVRQGIYLEFDERGTVTVKAYYHNDVYEGEFITYKRGRISEKKTYSGGKLNGPKQSFYDNGKPKEDSNFVDGKIHGIAKYYNQQGELLFEYKYENGQLIK